MDLEEKGHQINFCKLHLGVLGFSKLLKCSMVGHGLNASVFVNRSKERHYMEEIDR